MKKTITTCDICGQELDRWYKISVYVNAKYDRQNVEDMMEIDGVPVVTVMPVGGVGYMRVPPKHLCKECMTIIVKSVRRMRYLESARSGD